MPHCSERLPNLILFEDDDLLVIHKPAGWNTHAPTPYSGEGVFEWLRHREPRWATLAIIHRLDKVTSGVMVFAKSTEAKRSLTAQFTERTVTKKYLLATDRSVPRKELTVVSTLRRVGDGYEQSPWRPGQERAETSFRVTGEQAGRTLVEATPVTGRTHQIRVHAAAEGFPIFGDVLYGGTPARRVHLHALELTVRHPASNEPMTFVAPAAFETDARLRLREAIIDPAATTAFRLMNGASDGSPGTYVDRLGGFVLVQEAGVDQSLLTSAATVWGTAPRGVYHKILNRQVRKTTAAEASPILFAGEAAPERFEILENGVRFELSFSEGYSVGLFLDQRDNRRRFLMNHVAADFPLFPGGAAGHEVLNTFAYTCGFSVCAAKAGARVTSLDLSRKYLEWGRRNFSLNGLEANAHDFIYGDAFDWMRRLAKKGRLFDAIILDPPTFSQSKETGVFRADKDYGKLVAAALPVLRPGGVLFASTNAATLKAEDFVAIVAETMVGAGRRIGRQHYVPQPPDFPVSREEPAYLKSVWTEVS